MVEVALLAVLSVGAGIVFGILRRADLGAAGLWLAACGSIFAAGVCHALVGHELPWILPLGWALSAAYPALLLCGAIGYLGRATPAWIVPAALAAGALRAAAAQAGLPVVPQLLGLASQPALALSAAVLLLRAPAVPPSSTPQRLLAPSLLVVAALEALTVLTIEPAAVLPLPLLGAWVVVVPLALAVQVAAEGDRAKHELRRARDRLGQRVAERTAELSESVAELQRMVSEREAAERAARESEERYRAVSELSSDYSFAVHIRPDNALEVEWITDAFSQVTGYEAGSLTGSGWLRLIPPSDRQRAIQDLAEVVAGERREMEVRLVTQAGEERLQAVRFGSSTALDDGSVRIVGAARDVTELRRAEDERRRLDRVVRERQRIESLAVLAGGIAHDFNNLLTVIRGNTRLALDEMASSPVARERLARVQAASDHAAELTEQMLTYSGKATRTLKRIDLSRTVREALDLMRASIAEKHQLDVELADELPAIRGDRTQLRQVLLNLAGNASEAIGSEGGRIEVRTGVRTLEEADLAGSVPTPDPEPGRYVFLEVCDSGPGIDDELMGRIFEPFFTTKPTGRGLGLAAVFGIVAAHRGVIELKSGEEGTRFRVLFPEHERGGEPRARPGAGADRKAGERSVLVVDDDEWVRELAEEFLVRAGFRVLTADGGPAAVALLEAHPEDVDAVVLDLAMPEMSGEETLAELRRLRPDLPAILASGYDSESLVARLGRRSSVRFVPKPFGPEDLVGRVREALELTRRPDPAPRER